MAQLKDEYFNIKIEDNEIQLSLKKKYIRAMNKLVKQCKKVAKAMNKLGEIAPKFSVEFHNKVDNPKTESIDNHLLRALQAEPIKVPEGKLYAKNYDYIDSVVLDDRADVLKIIIKNDKTNYFKKCSISSQVIINLITNKVGE